MVLLFDSIVGSLVVQQKVAEFVLALRLPTMVFSDKSLPNAPEAAASSATRSSASNRSRWRAVIVHSLRSRRIRLIASQAPYARTASRMSAIVVRGRASPTSFLTTSSTSLGSAGGSVVVGPRCQPSAIVSHTPEDSMT